VVVLDCAEKEVDMDWTAETPIKGGWYLYRKDGIERSYFLKPFGFTHPLMPDDVLFALDGPDAEGGKNIIGILNDEFVDCEWMGPLSPEPLKQWMDSIPVAV
jgi:hypothetical protein